MDCKYYLKLTYHLFGGLVFILYLYHMEANNEVKVRFNYGRVVAVLDRKDLDAWVLGADLYQPFMYTIHGIGEVTDVEKYKKHLVD